MAAVELGNTHRSKRWLPVIAIVAIWMLVIVYVRPDPVEPIHCESQAVEQAADVVMLSASWCQYCRRARQYFVSEAIYYCEWDIERTERGAALYEQSKHQGIPIIYIRDEELVGFSAAQIEQLLTKRGIATAP